MTRTRHRSCIDIVFLTMLILASRAGGAFAAGVEADAAAGWHGTSERFATDSRSGLALDGFDPVAYFDEGRPRPGLAAHEAVVDGVAWRFASLPNKAAFLTDPAAYAPRFGGHAAEACARGLLVDADPQIFAVAHDRLYVFRTVEGRRGFLADASLADEAERVWRRLAD